MEILKKELESLKTTQIQHGVKIEAREKDSADIWAELNKTKEKINEVKTKSAVKAAENKANNATISKMVFAGPTVLIAGLGFLASVIFGVWQAMK
ncbi:hypothetical protein N9917_02460 [Deltaproteobacteria bacterium]|nr:hypothetical protein [Deltaproteobacteria bacterium]